MASVWYIGDSTKRIMSEQDWTKAGTEGDIFQWTLGNGWSIDRAVFTPAQIIVLAQDKGFWTNAPDGPRVWSMVPGNPPGGELNPGDSPIARMIQILAQAQALVDSITDVAEDAEQVAQDRIFVDQAKGVIAQLKLDTEAAALAASQSVEAAEGFAEDAEADRVFVSNTKGEIVTIHDDIILKKQQFDSTFLNINQDVLPYISASVDEVEADRLAAQASAAAAAISEANAAATGGVTSVGGFQGAVTKTQLEINNVDNTRDIDKRISTPVQEAFDFLSAAFGSIISGVQTEVATKQDEPQVNAIVSAAISTLVGAAPGSLDTIYELAAALQGNSATIGDLATAIGLRAMANAVVNLTGNQDVSGTKNFTTGLQQGGKAVVVTDDARMSNARTPTSHSHVMGDVTGLASELSTINGALLMKVNSVTGQTITFWAGTQAQYDALSSGTRTAAGFIAAIF